MFSVIKSQHIFISLQFVPVTKPKRAGQKQNGNSYNAEESEE